MTGKPIERKLTAALTARGRELGHEVTENGEAEAQYAIASWIMEGKTAMALAREFGVSVSLLYRWINKTDDRHASFIEARRVGAHALVDLAQERLENATNASISVDREVAKLMMWRASRSNRADYGEDKSPAVQINLGDLHIEALTRQPERPTLRAAQPETVIEHPQLED